MAHAALPPFFCQSHRFRQARNATQSRGVTAASYSRVPPSVTCTSPNRWIAGSGYRSGFGADGMPPLAVEIVDTSECRTVTGAPKCWIPCAATLHVPADPSATGGGDALATVTCRNGLGKAFLYLLWRTFPTGRGPIYAVLEAHNP